MYYLVVSEDKKQGGEQMKYTEEESELLDAVENAPVASVPYLIMSAERDGEWYTGVSQ